MDDTSGQLLQWRLRLGFRAWIGKVAGSENIPGLSQEFASTAAASRAYLSQVRVEVDVRCAIHHIGRSLHLGLQQTTESVPSNQRQCVRDLTYVQDLIVKWCDSGFRRLLADSSLTIARERLYYAPDEIRSFMNAISAALSVRSIAAR